jgi:hypothetical protein
MSTRLLLGATAVLAVWMAMDVSCSAPQADAEKDRAAAPPPRVAKGSIVYQVTATPTSVPDAVVTATRETSFAASVRPILLSHCAPCHEPGGKMYDRLPFDRAETIASHREGVLRRIKAEDERAAIEKWLAAKESGS